jgi:hypothetical protein
LALVSCGSAQPAFAKDSSTELTEDQLFDKLVNLCRKDEYEASWGNKGWLRSKATVLPPAKAQTLTNYCRFYKQGFVDGVYITFYVFAPKKETK